MDTNSTVEQLTCWWLIANENISLRYICFHERWETFYHLVACSSLHPHSLCHVQQWGIFHLQTVGGVSCSGDVASMGGGTCCWLALVLVSGESYERWWWWWSIVGFLSKLQRDWQCLLDIPFESPLQSFPSCSFTLSKRRSWPSSLCKGRGVLCCLPAFTMRQTCQDLYEYRNRSDTNHEHIFANN